MGQTKDITKQGSVGNTSGDSNRVINYFGDNWTDINAIALTPLEGEIAYARNSEGTAWLPGTLLGTYYPSGLYVYDGADWVSDRNAIADQLQTSIDDIDQLQIGVALKEDAFSKNTAFNKNFGSSSGTVLEGDTTTITPTQAANILTNNGKVSFPEAPNDGTQYVRKDLAWEAVTPGAGNPFNNTVIVQSLSDLPTASGGKIVLASSTNYYIDTALLNLGTDYLECSENTVINSPSATTAVIAYSGTGAAVRGVDVGVSFAHITFSAPKVFDFTNTARDKNFILQNCIIVNQTSASTVVGCDICYLNVINYALNSGGFEFTDNTQLIFDSQNFRLSNTGTFIKINPQTYTIVSLISGYFDAPSESIALDITSTDIDSGQISTCTFKGDGTRLNGISANTTNWDIAPRANIGIAGLNTFQLTVDLQTWTHNGTYAEIPETNLLNTAEFYEPNATTILAILRASVSHDQSGKRTDVDLRNITDNLTIAGSELETVITTSDIYQEVSSSEFTITEDKAYRIRLQDFDGTGQNFAKIRSAVLEIKVF